MNNEIIISGYTRVSLTIPLEVLKGEFISEKYVFAIQELSFIVYDLMLIKEFLEKSVLLKKYQGKKSEF